MKRIRVCGPITVFALAAALLFGPARAQSQNAAQTSKSVDAPAGNVEAGKKIFNKYGCYECHGREGQGTTMGGPRIGPNPVPFEYFMSYVRKPTREMPPYTAKVVTDQEMADIYAFLQARAQPPATMPAILK
ncbi:MAG: cytochrome c [Acidobacteriia bacterium]|nr:cytochrome c [Terriglobia bacterium]